MSRPIIDIYCHILPHRYKKALFSKAQNSIHLKYTVDADKNMPALSNLEFRLKMLRQFEGMRQVLSATDIPIPLDREEKISPIENMLVKSN